MSSQSITRSNTDEPPLVKWGLITIAVGYMVLFLVLPLILVFYQAFEKGFGEYWAVLSRPDTLRAIGMTLTTVVIAVPLNILFGLVAAWCIGKFKFFGKSFLISLIDLPFAVSPVIAGLLFVILFGLRSPLGIWLDEQGFGSSIPPRERFWQRCLSRFPLWHGN